MSGVICVPLGHKIRQACPPTYIFRKKDASSEWGTCNIMASENHTTILLCHIKVKTVFDDFTLSFSHFQLNKCSAGGSSLPVYKFLSFPSS